MQQITLLHLLKERESSQETRPDTVYSTMSIDDIIIISWWCLNSYMNVYDGGISTFSTWDSASLDIA